MPTFHNQNDFIKRIFDVVSTRKRGIVFMLGSGVSLCYQGKGGVPSANEIAEIVRSKLREPPENGISYQRAFEQLIEAEQRQNTANEVIQKAVLNARIDFENLAETNNDSPFEVFEELESEFQQWHISPAIEAISALCTHFPKTLGKTIITTNFDPLLEVAFARIESPRYYSALENDGSLRHTRGTGTHIVHIHGYWWGCNTLHTNFQLERDRNQLTDSIRKLLEEKILVVIGYGGWDDMFMKALKEEVLAEQIGLEILWAFYESDESKIKNNSKHILEILERPSSKQQASFFKGIDANRVLPQIFEKVTAEYPAETVEIFLERTIKAQQQRVSYQELCAPWRNENESPGDFVKLLSKFGNQYHVYAALYAVMYVLPHLEGQPVHQRPAESKHGWVRDTLNRCLTILDNKSDIPSSIYGDVIKLEYDGNDNTYSSVEKAIFRAAEYAVRAFLTVNSLTNSHGELKSKSWAARSVHIVSRTLYDDPGTMWEYVRRKLNNEYDARNYFNWD
jgi:hypothetical protein